jgi:hypothetical protein
VTFATSPIRGSRAAVENGLVALLAAPDEALPEPAEIVGTVEVRLGLPAVESVLDAALALPIALPAETTTVLGPAVGVAEGTGVPTVWAEISVLAVTAGAGVTVAPAVVPVVFAFAFALALALAPLPIVPADGVGVPAAGLAAVTVAPVNPDAVVDAEDAAPAVPALPDAALEPVPLVTPAVVAAPAEEPDTVVILGPVSVVIGVPIAPIDPAVALVAPVDEDAVAPPSASA